MATSIQEILNVRYKLVKNLKQVVEDSYKKRTKDTTSSVVNCCKHNAGSETEGENGFPFPVGGCNHNQTIVQFITGKEIYSPK